MKKIKLSNLVLSTIITGSSIVAIIPMASCTNKTKDEEKAVKPKINLKAAPSEIDMNSSSYPLTLTLEYDTALDVTNETGAKIYYRAWMTGPMGSGWTEVKEYTSTTGAFESGTIQLFAYNKNKPGTFSTDKGECHIGFHSPGTGAQTQVIIGGNAASLLLEKDPEESITPETEEIDVPNSVKAFTFKNLFSTKGEYKYRSIYNIGAGFLPFIYTGESCYENMFYGQEHLRTAPQLPSKSKGEGVENYGLPKNCYKGMFQGCSSLATSPYLPAIILGEGSYEDMFRDCTNLNCVSLGYVGNFSSKYCNNWLTGITNKGYFYYNGIDKEIGHTWDRPKTFEVVQDQKFIDDNIKIIHMVADSTSTVSDSKPSFATYGKLISMETITDTNQWPTFGPKTSTTTPVNFVYGSETISLTSEKFKKSLDEAFPGVKEITLTPTYAWHPYITPGYTNVVFNEAGTIKNACSGMSSKIQYSIVSDDGTQTPWMTLGKTAVTMTAKSVLILRGDDTSYDGLSQGWSKYQNIVINSPNSELRGTVMSLLRNKLGDFNTIIPNEACFFMLFSGSTISKIDEGFLPATKLKKGCYCRMFYKCTSLTNMPDLPAENVPDSRSEGLTYGGTYGDMFFGCSSLSKVGKFNKGNAVKLGSDACLNMFYNCSSLYVYSTSASTRKLFFKVDEVLNSSTENMFNGAKRDNNVKKTPKAGSYYA